MQPDDIVRFALKHKLEVISITDHDTLKGYHQAKKAARDTQLTLLPGVEITADFEGRECHLLAYCFDPGHTTIKTLIKNHYQSRLARAQWIIEQLSQQGLEVDIDEVRAETRGGNIGRPHIASVLVNKGYVASFKEAFIRYLSDQQLGAIYNQYHTHHEVVEMVKKAGGAVVIAHPGKLYSDIELQKLIDAGVDGIEVIHPSHKYEIQQRIELVAKKHQLLQTGGSDFHGGSKTYQKFFGVITIRTQWVNRLVQLTDQRKKISVYES